MPHDPAFEHHFARAELARTRPEGRVEFDRCYRTLATPGLDDEALVSCARTFHRLLAKIGHDVLPPNTMAACKALMRGQIDNNPGTLMDALNAFGARIRAGVDAHDRMALARANRTAMHPAAANPMPQRVTPTRLQQAVLALVNEGQALSKLRPKQISEMLQRQLNVAHEPSLQLSQLVMHHYRDVTGWRSEEDSRLLQAYRLVSDYVAHHYPGGIADNCTPPTSVDIDKHARTRTDKTYIRYAIAAHFGWNPQAADGRPREGNFPALTPDDQQAVLAFIHQSGSAIPREIAKHVFRAGPLNPIVETIRVPRAIARRDATRTQPFLSDPARGWCRSCARRRGGTGRDIERRGVRAGQARAPGGIAIRRRQLRTARWHVTARWRDAALMEARRQSSRWTR